MLVSNVLHIVVSPVDAAADIQYYFTGKAVPHEDSVEYKMVPS